MPDPSVRPSPEQEAAVARYLRGEDLKLLAVAGSGKTTTLRLMAEAAPKRRLLYLAFNRALAEEARERFPQNVTVRTLHALAWREVVRGNPRLEAKLGKGGGGGQVRPYHVARALGVRDPLLAMVIRDTLNRFVRSLDPSPRTHHISEDFRESRAHLDGERWADLEAYILEGVASLWKRMADETDPFPLSHDGYVRVWAERGGRIRGFEAALVDEAQDLDPVFAHLLEAHEGLLQRVYVGDPRQAIYRWRGAVDAMAGLQAPEAHLTWSFRFGDRLAEAVRRVSARSQEGPISVLGKAPWETAVDAREPAPPFAVLTRTNAWAIQAVLHYEPVHRGRVHVVGGVEELVWLIEDAQTLKEGGERRRPHPELLGIRSWDELTRLAEYAPSVRTLVDLLSAGLALSVADYLRRHQSPEKEALVVISTAHKAKGREWDRVVLWQDFYPWWEEGCPKPDPEEENLLYVAMTRARRHLSLRHLPTLAAALESPAPKPAPPSSAPDGLQSWAAEAAVLLLHLVEDPAYPEETRNWARALLRALGRAAGERKAG